MWQNPYLNPWGMGVPPVQMGPQRQVLRANGRESAKELQLQQAMCGVVRYPLSSAWNAGPYPPAAAAATG